VKTTFNNVGHGEAIFIQLDNGRGIVRDFGRAKQAKYTSTCCFPIDLLRSCRHTRKQCIPMIRKRTLDAVLSHAHEDHFSGFKTMCDLDREGVFENAYIPWLSMENLDSLGGLLIKYSLLLYRYYDPNTRTALNAKNWLLAAPVMAYISRKLWCVSAGHNVSEWGVSKILWPPEPSQSYQEKLRVKLVAYLSQNDPGSLFLELLNNDTEEILDVLRKFYPTSSVDQTGSEISSEDATKAIETISEVLLRRDRQLSSPEVLRRAYKSTLDDHGLVFEIGDGEEKALFLSDANDATVERMLKANDIRNQHYRTIKAGHHGNRGAKRLQKHNVTAGVVVNCCGPANNNYRGPSSEYLNVSKGDVICTDWNDSGSKWTGKTSYKISNTCRIVL